MPRSSSVRMKTLGSSSAASTRAPRCAQNSAALGTSLRAGHITNVVHSDTLADGVAGGMDDDSVTFPLAQELVDDLID